MSFLRTAQKKAEETAKTQTTDVVSSSSFNELIATEKEILKVLTSKSGSGTQYNITLTAPGKHVELDTNDPEGLIEALKSAGLAVAN